MQLTFCKIMAAFKVLYSKVHEVIATDLPQSKLKTVISDVTRDFLFSCAYSMFREYPTVCTYIIHELSLGF